MSIIGNTQELAELLVYQCIKSNNFQILYKEDNRYLLKSNNLFIDICFINNDDCNISITDNGKYKVAEIIQNGKKVQDLRNELTSIELDIDNAKIADNKISNYIDFTDDIKPLNYNNSTMILIYMISVVTSLFLLFIIFRQIICGVIVPIIFGR